MSLSPVRVEHVVPSGQSWTDVVTVENVSDRPLRARVTVADWFFERNGTPVFVKRGSRPEFSMSAWIELNPTEFEIAPGGTQVMRYTLTVPADVPSASYRTALLVESLPDFAETPGPNVAYLTARIGVIIYNHVGVGVPHAQVVDQAVVSDDDAPGGLSVKLTIRNPGLVNFRVSGESQILTPDGHVFQVFSIPDGVVLPKSERDILLPLLESVEYPAFTVHSRIDVGQPELLEIETRVGVVAAYNSTSDE